MKTMTALNRRARAVPATVTLWLVDLTPWGSPANTGRPEPVVADHLQRARRAATDLVARTSFAEKGSTIEPRVVRYCPVCGGDGHGRPNIAGSGLHLSASASGDWAVVAVSEMPVGVDIQAPGRCRTVPAALLAEAELTALAAVRPEAHWDAFLRIWTAKEAVAKIDGRGLMAPLQQLDTSGLLANASGEVVMAGAHWHVEAITVAAPAALALATERPVTVVLRTLELGPMP